METGGSGVAGLRDTAGHRTCTKGGQASSLRPTPRNTGGSFREVGSKFLSGPFPGGVKAWNMRALNIGERSQTAERGRGRLGGQERRSPRSQSLNTRARPEGRAPEGVKGVGSPAAAITGALWRGKRPATSLPSERPTSPSG